MRVLVTGASGLLGGRLAGLLAAHFSVVGAVHRGQPPEGTETVPLDLEDAASIRQAVAGCHADAIVHAGALADADACEADPGLARRVNVEATAVLAESAARASLRFVYVSTDLVFAGDRPFVGESDPAVPVMTYGHTKLAAEEMALGACPEAAVVRCALVYGRGFGGRRSTASEGIAQAVRAGRRPRLFTDQYRTPIDPESVADALVKLLHGDESGRFHLGGPERLSRYELGLRVAATLGLSPRALEPVPQAEGARGAPRPLDVSLDSTRARLELGWQPRPLRDGIAESRLDPPP